MNLGPETEYVEHKRSTGEHRVACESIASMLNRHGRGTVYFGVRNDGEVVVCFNTCVSVWGCRT